LHEHAKKYAIPKYLFTAAYKGIACEGDVHYRTNPCSFVLLYSNLSGFTLNKKNKKSAGIIYSHNLSPAQKRKRTLFITTSALIPY
jgi:hypothetical protein